MPWWAITLLIGGSLITLAVIAVYVLLFLRFIDSFDRMSHARFARHEPVQLGGVPLPTSSPDESARLRDILHRLGEPTT